MSPAPETTSIGILQVLPRLVSGGVERGTLEMAEAINNAGWRSFVASEGGILVSSLGKYRTTHFQMPLASKNPFTLWRNAVALVDVIRTHNIKLIHARSRAPAWSARLAAHWAGIPFVTTFHGHYSVGAIPYKKFYNSVMVSGDRVIAISHFTAEHIRQIYKVKEDKLRIIPRGVDMRSFNPTLVNRERTIALTRQWQLPDDKPIIFMPARFTGWKGHMELVEALAMLPHRNFFCVMAGEMDRHPHYIKQLDKHIVKNGLAGCIQRVEPTRDMTTAYMMSHLVVCPSVRPEAFGRVAAEAGAMGRAVIGFNHGGLKETVLHGRTGWLASPGKIEELSKAIDNFLNLDEDARSALAATAHEHIATHFSTQQMCDQTLALYRELLLDRADGAV